MKIILGLLAVCVGVPILFLITMYGASELGGEVVTLHRTEASGEISEVRIWIVDSEGMSWIEHGDPESPWITRLTESPQLVLDRGGRSTTYTGTPDRDAHDLYHRLRREKYGVADQIIATMTGSAAECPGVPVRLQIID